MSSVSEEVGWVIITFYVCLCDLQNYLVTKCIFLFVFFFRQIEGKVMEIAKLQETFTEKVLEQVSSLCLLYFIITKTEEVYILYHWSPLCKLMGLLVIRNGISKSNTLKILRPFKFKTCQSLLLLIGAFSKFSKFNVSIFFSHVHVPVFIWYTHETPIENKLLKTSKCYFVDTRIINVLH